MYKNSQAVKSCAAPKCQGEKRCEIRWWPRNGWNNSSMAKILITTNQVNLKVSPKQIFELSY